MNISLLFSRLLDSLSFMPGIERGKSTKPRFNQNAAFTMSISISPRA